MDIKNLLVVMVIAQVALAGGCATPAGGQWPRKGVVSPSEARPSAVVASAQNLRLTVETDRAVYEVGEPVYATVRLQNTGSRSQRVFGSLDPISGATTILVAGPDGKQKIFVPLVEADHDPSILRNLEPGTVIGDVSPIFFGAHGWTFKKPGRYTIGAAYETPDGKGGVLGVRSELLAITVQPSTVGEDMIGQGNGVSDEVGKFLTWMTGDHLEKGRAKLLEVIERKSDSVLANYAHAAFARSAGESFMDYRKREVRPPDCGQAMGHIAKTNTESLPSYVRLQIAITGARCAARAGESVVARRYIGSAKELTLDKPEYRGLSDRITQLEKYIGTN